MYVRMISKRGKWNNVKDKSYGELSSDAVTKCLKTTGETLSLWYAKDEKDIDKAIVALASTKERIDTLDYIVIEDSLIDSYELELSNTEGKSAYVEFNKQHFDIIGLNYLKLGKVIELIHNIVSKEEDAIKRIKSKQIKQKLKSALDNGKLSENHINKDLLGKLVEEKTA